MGKDRYHYDKKNNYQGHSSDKPPSEDYSGCIILLLIAGGYLTLTSLLDSGSPFAWVGDLLIWIAVIAGVYLLAKWGLWHLRNRNRGRTKQARIQNQPTIAPNLTPQFSAQCHMCKRDVVPDLVGKNGRAKYKCPTCGHLWTLKW